MKTPLQFFLIALATLTAFTLPRAKSGARDLVQALFVPVSLPAHAIGAWATNRLSPRHEVDVLSPNQPRDFDAIKKQNQLLLTQLASLQGQLDAALQQLAQFRVIDADLRSRIRSATVVGWPTNNRQALTISTRGLGPVREGLAVIDPKGFVGRVYSIATGGATARVLLATDPESHYDARFARFVPDAAGGGRFVAVATPPPLVEGSGRGLVIRKLAAVSVRNVVRVNDVVLLSDATLPSPLRDLRLGTVSKIKLPPTDAGFAEIDVTPVTDLGALRDVLVVGG